MLEIRITAPELSEALNNLAKALASNQCGCGHTECSQSDKNGIQIENSGTINVEVPQTEKIAPTAITTPVATNPTVPTSAPQTVPTAPTAPIANNPTPEVPTVPTVPTTAVPTAAPQYTLEMIAKAGTSLIDAGKLSEVSALLGKYGVDALTSLNPSMYGAVAMDLRAMGAQI